jgi:hypothetical protein
MSIIRAKKFTLILNNLTALTQRSKPSSPNASVSIGGVFTTGGTLIFVWWWDKLIES